MNHRVILAVALVAVVHTAGIAQTTRNVPGQYATIQAAINASVNGDTVLVFPGVYPGAITFLGKGINVHSSGGAAATTITGTPNIAVVTFATNEGSTSVLNGFTITAGTGITIQNSSPTIQNCRIVNNYRIGSGGGIYCTTSGASVASPVITGCVISNNFSVNAAGAVGGAGLAFDGQSSATSLPSFSNCSVSGNVATTTGIGVGPGGAIALSGKWSATFVGCDVDGNTTPDVGGGCFVGGGNASFTSCRIAGNHASYGGAFHVSNGSLNLVACMVVDNSAEHMCGAIYSSSSNSQPQQSITIKNCTIAGNSAAQSIGGMAMFGSGLPVMTISNSIVWGNSGTNIEALTAAITYSDIGAGLFNAGAGTISVDPRYLDAANGDYHLASTSPCRDAGAPSTTGLPATDLDGTPRVVGSAVDMGSDEVPALTYPATSDGLDLYAAINGAGDPLASTRPAIAGNLLTVRLKSATGSLVGGLPIFGAELFPNAAPPAALGPIWLDNQAIIIYGALIAPPFGFPGLAPEGLTFNFTVPPGLGGMTVRMQGAVSSINALNGLYATSNATEVTF